MSEASFLQLPFAIRTTLNFGGYMMQFPVLFSAVSSIFLAVFSVDGIRCKSNWLVT